MSGEERITKVEKEKDPRRVEAGRKLGALSKAAKERKAAERSRADNKDAADDTNNIGTSCMSVIAGVGVLTGLVCLYFTYKQDKRAARSEVSSEVNNEVNNEAQPNNNNLQKPIGSRLHSLDD